MGALLPGARLNLAVIGSPASFVSLTASGDSFCSRAFWSGVAGASFQAGAASYDTGHGSAFQMPAAYSAMVRSLENFPEPAIFKMAFRAQASPSWYSALTRF